MFEIADAAGDFLELLLSGDELRVERGLVARARKARCGFVERCDVVFQRGFVDVGIG